MGELVVEATEKRVEIQEGGVAEILLEKNNDGVVLSIKDQFVDANDRVDVIKPVDFVSFANEDFNRELRDAIETLIMNHTSESHYLVQGSVSKTAVGKLIHRDQDTEGDRL